MRRNEIRTKRMIISPMDDGEIEDLIENAESSELRSAYEEMLAGCKKEPDKRIWYAPWKMVLKSSQKYVGDLCFKGPVRKNAVEIGYGILPEYEGNGYATEAVSKMTKWAFFQKGILFVEAETIPENKRSQRVLEKVGFVSNGTGKEGPRFILEKPLPEWTTSFMCFGMSIGMAIGAFQNEMVIGMAIGMSIGAVFGMIYEREAKKQRENLMEKKRN